MLDDYFKTSLYEDMCIAHDILTKMLISYVCKKDIIVKKEDLPYLNLVNCYVFGTKNAYRGNTRKVFHDMNMLAIEDKEIYLSVKDFEDFSFFIIKFYQLFMREYNNEKTKRQAIQARKNAGNISRNQQFYNSFGVM